MWSANIFKLDLIGFDPRGNLVSTQASMSPRPLPVLFSYHNYPRHFSNPFAFAVLLIFAWRTSSADISICKIK